ncbi:hypothetical protein IFO70_05990 [Phormidium tenue FACHB-886]|nr:hypothetical protein [Phormidium tenue FACHB-886]
MAVNRPDRKHQLPWLSLLLLLAAYATFSWFLTHTFNQFLTFSTTAFLAWGLVLSFTLLQALLLTTLFDGLKLFLNRWLRSDIGYFSLIIILSMGVTIAIVWFGITNYFVVLIAAELLARLDLESARFSRLQTLLILSLISIGGLAIGLFATVQLDEMSSM